MSQEFISTRRLFEEYIGYTHPYTYDEWNKLPKDYKTSALYVQFFDQILFAYYNKRKPSGTEEECVETVIQYLMKNVPIIEANSLKYTPAYIYRVCANCIYCVGESIGPVTRYKLEISNNTIMFDEPADIFDYTEDKRFSDEHDYDKKYMISRFWKYIDSLEEDVQMYVSIILLGGNGVNKCRFNKNKQEIAKNKLKDHLNTDGRIFKDYFYTLA